MDIISVGNWLEINQQIAMICVWHVHTGHVEQGLVLAASQGVNLTEEDMREIAIAFRTIWQIDAGRHVRERCFLCNRKLPPQEEELCKCFRKARVGRYIDPITPQTIGALKRMYRDWKNIPIETYQCEDPSCGALDTVTAGVAANKFAKGRDYISPRLCMNCYYAKQEQQQMQQQDPQRDRRAPPHNRDARKPLRTPVRDAPKVQLKDFQAAPAEPPIDLKELQEKAVGNEPLVES